MPGSQRARESESKNQRESRAKSHSAREPGCQRSRESESKNQKEPRANSHSARKPEGAGVGARRGGGRDSGR